MALSKERSRHHVSAIHVPTSLMDPKLSMDTAKRHHHESVNQQARASSPTALSASALNEIRSTQEDGNIEAAAQRDHYQCNRSTFGMETPFLPPSTTTSNECQHHDVVENNLSASSTEPRLSMTSENRRHHDTVNTQTRISSIMSTPISSLHEIRPDDDETNIMAGEGRGQAKDNHSMYGVEALCLSSTIAISSARRQHRVATNTWNRTSLSKHIAISFQQESKNKKNEVKAGTNIDRTYRLRTWKRKTRVHVTPVKNDTDYSKSNERNGKSENIVRSGIITPQQTKITEFLHTRANSLYKETDKSYEPDVAAVCTETTLAGRSATELKSKYPP